MGLKFLNISSLSNVFILDVLYYRCIISTRKYLFNNKVEESSYTNALNSQ